MKIAAPSELVKLRPFRFYLGIATVWVVIVASWLACGIWPIWPIWLAAAVLIGIELNGIGNLLHDAFHWRVHSSKQANDLIARIFLSGPSLIPLTSGRHSHAAHHRLLAKSEDSDWFYYGNANKADISDFLQFLFSLFSGIQFLRVGLKVLFGKHRKVETGTISNTKAAAADLLAILLMQLVIAGLLWAITGLWWAWVPLWLAPVAMVYVGLNSLRSFCEHVEYSHDELPETQSLTRLYSIRSNAIERWIVSPFNMNFHAEHHMSVAVPYYNLPAYREYLDLENAIEYRSSYLGILLKYMTSLPLKPSLAEISTSAGVATK